MPNRILKDSICTSPNIDALSRDAECFFYRLLVQCDDFGRMDARTPILRAKCYPLQIDRVSPTDISNWMAELVHAELVLLYTVDGKQFLHMRTWERHQQIRAKQSKYPQPLSDDINCNHMLADAPVIQSNPIQSESESESNVLSADKTPPKAPKPPTSAQQDMFGAIAETCELDVKLKQGVIAKNAKALLAAGYTPEQVRGFKEWWQADSWRMERTPVPTLNNLTEKLSQFRNANGRMPTQATVPRTNGKLTNAAITGQAFDLVEEMIRNGTTT